MVIDSSRDKEISSTVMGMIEMGINHHPSAYCRTGFQHFSLGPAIHGTCSLITVSLPFYIGEMAHTFSEFQELKLVTEFLDGAYKHTTTEKPLRCETWTRAETLGEGTYGTVYKEICAENKKLRAVKEIKKPFARPNELAILAKLRSYPGHFVQLVGWFEDEHKIYLAMEYLPGDLDALLKESNMSEDDIKRVTKQILAGLEIMHNQGICHRDLKPGNILIAKWIPISVKIADFGVSKHFDGKTQGRTTAGTKPFMAPEIWGFGDSQSSVYTTAVDMWSLGCLVYFMMTDRTPFPEPRHLVDFMEGRGTFPPSSASAQKIPHLAIGFMASLLRPLPEDRATASKAQLHSWLIIKEKSETLWTHPWPQPNEPAARTAPKKITRAEEDPQPNKPAPKAASKVVNGAEEAPQANKPVSSVDEDRAFGIKRKSTPPAPPAPPAPPPAPPGSLAPPAANKQPRFSAALGRREAIQHIVVAAAAGGNCTLLEAQLKKGGSPMGEISGYTPIYLAAKNGHLSAVKQLLDHGAHLGTAGSRQHSALHGASKGGKHQLAQYLLDMGADIEATDSDSMSALSRAVEAGHLETVKLLVEKGASISEYVGSAGWTVLLLAARKGHLETTRFLLDSGADISAKNRNDGWAALHFAAEGGHSEVVSLLLDRAADVTHRSDLNFCAHHIATHRGHLETLKLLVDSGADISEYGGPEGWNDLQLAAAEGHLHIIRFLLDRNADISSKKRIDGWTALHLAARHGHSEVVGLLLERGANVSETTVEGFCAHHLCAENGNLEVLKVLLDGGADISEAAQDGHGWTVLHLAAWKGYLDMTRFLLDRDADITAKKRNNGWDALHLAAGKGHLEVVRLLLERGASTISITSDSGDTAAALAAAEGHIDIVLMLVGWSEEDMTIPSTQLDNLVISDDQIQVYTTAMTGDLSVTTMDSTVDSPEL